MRGSCACGGIRYELKGQLEWMNHCHCTTCRKVHGAAFGTFGHGKASEFCWIQGEDLIVYWQSSAENTRNFCRVCGSNVPTVATHSDDVRIPMGTVDDDAGLTPMEHYYTSSKAGWYEILDELPQHEQLS